MHKNEVWVGEVFKGEWSTLDVSCYEVLAFVVMEGVPQQDAKA